MLIVENTQRTALLIVPIKTLVIKLNARVKLAEVNFLDITTTRQDGIVRTNVFNVPRSPQVSN